MGPVEKTLHEKLEKALKIDQLEIINNSKNHRGHAGNPGGGETHFKITIISDDFKGKTRLERHRMIFSILEEELKNPVHALSLYLCDPSEIA